MLRLSSLNSTRQQSCLVGLGRWRIESLTPQFDDVTLVRRSAWCPVPLDRPSNRDEYSLRFETPDNTCNKQRGVLGSAFLEEKYVLLCLSARAITEAAQDQARHAPLPADLRHRRAFHLGRVGFELFAQRVLLRGRGHASPVTITPVTTPRGPFSRGRLHRRELEVQCSLFSHGQQARVGWKEEGVRLAGERVHRPADAKPFQGPLSIIMVCRFGADHDIAGAEVWVEASSDPGEKDVGRLELLDK